MTSKETQIPETNDAMSLEESFHNCFFYFIKALDVLASNADEQCDVMGNFHVAWEIQHDVLDPGESLINWPLDYVSQPEKDAIRQLITLLRELPDDALVDDHLKAMNHPYWAELRLAASHLRVQLETANKRNLQFFDNQKLQ